MAFDSEAPSADARRKEPTVSTEKEALPPLSSRLRAGIECASWVIEEVRKLEGSIAAAQQGAQVPQGLQGEDAESRAMFVARLEHMQENGDHWLTVAAVLALLNDCDMLSVRPASPQAPAIDCGEAGHSEGRCGNASCCKQSGV